MALRHLILPAVDLGRPVRILIPITVMMTGCVSHYANSNFVATQSPPFAIEPIPAGNVAVISTAPRRPFVELGFIESDSFDGYGEAPEWARASPSPTSLGRLRPHEGPHLRRTTASCSATRRAMCTGWRPRHA